VVIVDKVEKIFASVPPKFLLDHYLNVLNLISWGRFVESEDREHFTISDLVEKLSRDAQRYHTVNPFYSRECSRSIAVVKEVLDELVSLGLLTKDGEVFRKTEDFPEFYHLLKNKVKRSLRRYVAWAILYLHHSKASNHFPTSEIVDLLSYSDREYLKEIPYLVKWKNGSWLSLLEKRNEKWRLVEKPYQPTKSILLLDIYDRLHLAILELSRLKNELSSEEIITKVRELESKSVEGSIKKLGLKYREGNWFIGNKTIKRIKETLLRIEELEWPLFGVRSSTNPYFKIEGETHNVYVDMPNQLITEFIENFYSLAEKHKEDHEILYNESIKLANEFNTFLRENFGNWLFLSIRKEFFGKRLFGIRVKIDWSLFQKFLEEFAERGDISLEDKYEYLSMCRFEIAWMRKEPSKELMERRVKSLSKDIVKEINITITSFIEMLYEKRRKYREKLMLKRKIAPLTLAYLPEIIQTFKLINECVKRGVISTCYREMRKTLESLSWVIIDDLLLFRGGGEEFRRLEFIPPLRIPTKRWYNWARDKGLIIKSLHDFTKPFQVIRERIGERFKVNRIEIENSLFHNLKYPLFLALAKCDETPPENLKGIIPSYKADAIKSFIKEDLRRIMQQLTPTPHLNLDEGFLEDLIKLLINAKQSFSIRYPSNSFIIQLLSKISGLNILLETYENYSYFVHSYDKTWQFYPFSSVLEFKIFRNELTRFISLIREILDFYDEEIL